MKYKFIEGYFVQGSEGKDVDEQVNDWLSEEFKDKIIVSHSMKDSGYGQSVSVIYTNQEES